MAWDPGNSVPKKGWFADVHPRSLSLVLFVPLLSVRPSVFSHLILLLITTLNELHCMLHAVLNQRLSSNKHFSIPAGCSENGLMIVLVHPLQHYNDVLRFDLTFSLWLLCARLRWHLFPLFSFSLVYAHRRYALTGRSRINRFAYSYVPVPVLRVSPYVTVVL